MICINIELDEKLINADLKATGLKTRKVLINYALKELQHHKDQMKLSKLSGSVSREGNLRTSRKN